MKADFPYKRLPGRLRGWVRKASLWEGSDHVLLVHGTRFQEDYRRFAYRDIESLQMVKTFRSGSFGWLAINGLLCFAVLPSTLIRHSWAGLAILSALLILLLGQLSLSFFLGCRCYVQTAVSREELRSLIRRGAAEKTFKRLRARIAEAQGELTEDLGALVDGLEGTETGVSLLTPQPADNARAARRSVNLAMTAFVLFLLDAAQTYPALEGPAADPHWFNSRFVTAAMVLAMIGTITGALLTGLGVRRLKGLRGWLLAALVAVVFDLYVSLLLPSLYTVQGRAVSMNMPQFKVWQTTSYADEIALLVMGFGGLLFVLVNWVGLRRGDL